MKRTIKSKGDFDRIFSEGSTVRMPHVMVRYLATPNTSEHKEQRDLCGRVAFVAGKRVGNAVVRNRCKRVMREAARKAGAPLPGYDLVFIARNTSLTTMGAEELEHECGTLLNRIRKQGCRGTK